MWPVMKKYKYLMRLIVAGTLSLTCLFIAKKNNCIKTKTHPAQKKTVFSLKPLPKQTPRLVSKHSLKQYQFKDLGHWDNIDLTGSLHAFQQSCRLWVHQNPQQHIGSSQIPMTVNDWLPICHQALHMPKNPTHQQTKMFFETYFQPYHWVNYHKGKFTGYYSPEFEGSPVKTAEYKTPLYSAPKDLVSANVDDFSSDSSSKRNIYGRLIGNHLKPYFSRAEIYQGALKNKAKIIAWLKTPLDAMLLEIEGSGVIKTPAGKHLYVGYAGENGRKYKSIAQLMINNHIFSRSRASVGAIKKYFEKYPQSISRYVNLNPSFVFFSRNRESGFKGAQNVVLTPKFSLAVDRKYIPYGIPLFLRTTCPINKSGDTRELNRVVIAQDTGGAIKGPIRGDIYWGAGSHAMQVASLMSQEGDYWFLLPKHFQMS